MSTLKRVAVVVLPCASLLLGGLLFLYSTANKACAAQVVHCEWVWGGEGYNICKETTLQTECVRPR